MRSLRALLKPLPVSLTIAALACAAASFLDHATIKHLLDARSGDGYVESYTTAFHARVQHHVRVLVGLLLVCASLSVLLHTALQRGWLHLRLDAGRFRTDLRAWVRHMKRTMGPWEVAVVLALVAVGASLRAALLREAVIYDEAFTCTYYAVRPWYIAISDYSYPNNHILHTLLVKASMALFGWGEVQARMPAFAAGLLAMIACWAWVRTAHGAGAALWSLVFVAFSGPLVEYSALARGYSLTWLILLAGLPIARHFIRTGNRFSGVLLALINALGMWAVPTMLYGTLTLYLFTFHGIWKRGGEEGPAHLRRCIASGLTFVAITLVLYLPVLVVYGPGQLFYDDTMGPRSWAHFIGSLGHKLDELGVHFTQEAPWTWSLVLVAGPVLAAILEPGHRRLMAALVLATLPVVLLQHMLGPPRVWDFVLWILLSGAGIACNVLVQRARMPLWASSALGAGLALLLAVPFLHDRPGRANRFEEARATVDVIRQGMGPHDRVAVYVMWQSPIEFYMIKEGMGSAPLYRPTTPGAQLWLVLGTEDGTRMDEVLRFARIDPATLSAPKNMGILPRSMIFAARING